MELFRTMAFGLFLVGFIAFSQLVEASPQRSQNEKVHELLAAQMAKILQSTLDSMPEYEIVQFHAPRVTDTESEPFEVSSVDKVFGNDLKLLLEPAEGVLAGKSTPVYSAAVDPASGEILYYKIADPWKDIDILLEDRSQQASLVQRTNSKGQHTYDGFIGTRNLVVRSLPESISDSLEKKNASHDSDSSKDSKTAYHVVYRMPKRNHSPQINATTGSSASLNTSAFTIPGVIYPELLVVVDHALFKMHNYNINDTLTYILAFWNGVDLVYRKFEKPKIRFNIARVIIGAGERSTPYIADNMHKDTLIVARDAFNAAKKYFYPPSSGFRSQAYDVVIIMTGINMTDGSGRPGATGLASYGGACNINRPEQKEDSLVLMLDDGTFYRVQTGAHEFAHLLNAYHDDETPCGKVDGYLMVAREKLEKNHYEFSRCTVESISDFLRSHQGRCFYNEPVIKDPLQRALPGSGNDRDRQCLMLGWGISCYTGALWQDPCSTIYCYSLMNYSCTKITGQIPIDGVECGDGKKCSHGKCLAFHSENQIWLK